MRVAAPRSSLVSQLFAGIRLGPATALAAVIGNIILLGYFWQLGFMPTDLGPLLGLGVLVSLGVLAAMLVSLALVTATAMLPRLYELPELTRRQMAAAWTLPASVFVAWMTGLLWPDHLFTAWFLAALPASAGTLLVVIQALDTPQPHKLLASAFCAAVGAFLGLAFLLLVLGELIRVRLDSAWFLGVMVFGILLLFTFNVLLSRADDWGIAAGVLLVIAMLMGTVMLTYQGYVPQRVATLLGLRYDRPVELRVPQATCELLASTTKPIGDAQPWRCQAQGNAVKAHVDVRLGSRWLVRMTELNGRPTADQTVRITLPDDGTEMLLPPR